MTFFIPGIPTPTPRPRVGKGFGKGSGKGFMYTPRSKKLKAWEAAIYQAYIAHMEPSMFERGVPFALDAIFIMPRPKKHYIANNPDRPLRDNAAMFHVGKPDRDNLLKPLLDVGLPPKGKLQRADVWHDDSQCVWGTFGKIYTCPAIPDMIKHMPGDTSWIGNISQPGCWVKIGGTHA